MKRFLQRDTSDEYSRYLVFGDRGERLYTVKGKLTPSGDFIRIFDESGAAVCKIRRFGVSVLSSYAIRVSSEDTVRLNISAAAGDVSVRFRGISFCLRGSVVSGCYEIIDVDSSVICAVYRDYSKGCIQLTVESPERELLCIAAALCIDSMAADAAPALQMT